MKYMKYENMKYEIIIFNFFFYFFRRKSNNFVWICYLSYVIWQFSLIQNCETFSDSWFFLTKEKRYMRWVSQTSKLFFSVPWKTCRISAILILLPFWNFEKLEALHSIYDSNESIGYFVDGKFCLLKFIEVLDELRRSAVAAARILNLYRPHR
jgi:hypothetical protein